MICCHGSAGPSKIFCGSPYGGFGGPAPGVDLMLILLFFLGLGFGLGFGLGLAFGFAFDLAAFFFVAMLNSPFAVMHKGFFRLNGR
jgi:hypothetical protein